MDLRTEATKRKLQARLAEELVAAYTAMPAQQRYGLTLWGVRDADSWLRLPPFPPGDQPLAFDDRGEPKPMACAMVQAFARARSRPG